MPSASPSPDRERDQPGQRPATRRHRALLFTDAAAIVRAEYASDLSLDDVARRIASSRRQLQRAFAEAGQTTFRGHLTAVRMERAAELLASLPLPVREVAARVGYRQPAQFAKAFRRHHRQGPSEYRRAARRPAAALATADGGMSHEPAATPERQPPGRTEEEEPAPPPSPPGSEALTGCGSSGGSPAS